MNLWINYLLWCIVVGLLAGLALAQHSYVALAAEACSAYCAFHYRSMAAKGVIR